MGVNDEEDLTDGKGGVYKKVLRPGEGKCPLPGSDVSVHYEGFLMDSKKFDSSRDREDAFSFKLGVGAVIVGWDIAVATMQPGEISVFTVRADFAYGWEGKPPKIPVDATLRFEIELISWAPGVKPIADMNPMEKREHGLAKRTAGTRLLKAGEFASAADEFEAGVESLWTLHAQLLSGAPDPKILAEVAEALRSCLLNLSQCKLKLEEWEDAAGLCAKILTLPGEGSNVKAKFRRGVALGALEHYDEAKEELKAACLLDPKSKEIRAEYERVKAAHADAKRAERQAFGGMFSGEDSNDGPCIEDNVLGASKDPAAVGSGEWGGTGRPFAA